MKKLFFLLLFLLSFSVMAQELKTEFKGKLMLEADSFVGIDEFNNLYYISDNVLYKKTDKKVFSYSNPKLGSIHKVNIQNPFKIILFYADFNAAMLVDNNLNELSEVLNFTKETKFNNVSFVTGSSQNNIWLYADDNKLHLYDYKRNTELLQTLALTFYNPQFKPIDLVSSFKNVWVLADIGVFEFNEYGVFIRGYSLKDTSRIFPFQKGFIYETNGELYYNDLTQVIPLEFNYEGASETIYINSSKIYVYNGKEVYEFQIKS
ncbi:hypothetical protein [Lutimonas zeaxanthinifaciens]|uniref:hypothetical protein n=1 Tax=Lutimonas zeaxanthinifaciens TaxID=3060215 RepID=UPI00265CF1CD|nr:hypothetical protein [Lutimonas sp. YSD2104]WKK65769.1 hypothetical protein QZH61_14415 [Lutimonas sp. YSD2104]